MLHSGLVEISEAAAAYCAVIEDAKGRGRDPFVADAASTLATVVALAYRIPPIPVGAHDAPEPDGISHEVWLSTMKSVQAALGEWDDYWTTMSILEEAPVNLSLADALADIWRELRNGLDALESGSPVDDVLWDWRFGLRTHWGLHAVEALRALHQRVLASAESHPLAEP